MKNKKSTYNSIQFSEHIMFTMSFMFTKSFKKKKTLQIWEVVKLAHRPQTLVLITTYYFVKFQLFSLSKHVPIKIDITYSFSFPFCPYATVCHKEAAI